MATAARQKNQVPDIQRLQSKLTVNARARSAPNAVIAGRGVLCGRLGPRFITEAANGAACVSAKLCKKGKRQAQLGPFNEFHASPNFLSGALSANQLSDFIGAPGAADSKLEGGSFAWER
jgi:hypothetical protein